MTTQGLTPEESLLAAAIRLAIKDATKHKSENVRAEALRWLWWVAPMVAERAGVLYSTGDFHYREEATMKLYINQSNL